MATKDDQSIENHTAQVGLIVSSSHLASGSMPALSEMEYAMTVAHNAFAKWIVRCMSAAGLSGLTPLEVQVLHLVNHRDREKTLGDLCILLNIEDTHLITYAIKKLVKMGLVTAGKRGKEKTVHVSTSGQQACERYREVREALLIEGVQAMGLAEKDISSVAALLRVFSGQYDQAARGAASF